MIVTKTIDEAIAKSMRRKNERVWFPGGCIVFVDKIPGDEKTGLKVL